MSLPLWAGTNSAEDALEQLHRLTLQSCPASDNANGSSTAIEEMSVPALPTDKPRPSGATPPAGNR